MPSEWWRGEWLGRQLWNIRPRRRLAIEATVKVLSPGPVCGSARLAGVSWQTAATSAWSELRQPGAGGSARGQERLSPHV